MSVSQEFIDLCQAQLKLLVQGLSLSFGIVYLMSDTNHDGDETALVPVAVYPDFDLHIDTPLLLEAPLSADSSQAVASDWQMQVAEPAADGGGVDGLAFEAEADPSSDGRSTGLQLYRLPRALQGVLEEVPLPAERLPEGKSALPDQPSHRDRSQLVIPLSYSNMVLGLLVIDHVDKSWSSFEQRQIEQITNSLTAGCVLERRSRWLNQTLRQQHLAYEAFHQQQDTMLDTLLHQLRNPLTAVQTFGKLLMRRIQPGEPNRAAAEGITRESERIRQLLEQFDQLMAPLPPTLPARVADSVDSGDATLETLDLADALDSDIGSGVAVSVPSSHLLTGGDLQLAPLDLGSILTPLMQTATAIAQERSVTVHYEPIAPCWVRADATALQEVLNNLVDNAIKYTPDGGYVEVLMPESSPESSPVASVAEALQAVVIADTGPGIPAADQAHLFERHFRGVQAEGDIPGTGLGLAIAQELTQQMQGQLTVHSPAAESKLVSACYPQTAVGTAVIVHLPCAAR
ncbi:MAG: HAMP domain-containing sensor histidine kinase [Cyanobacteria bacterium P01_A01_bin.135]